ncbi:hypothetical protein WR25_07888 [Diploscapter pachys]|uniref:Uncharacterized protein n=1 Tax=Diploscapter pachys TaxID=2018661 RepID=A0A2A2K7B8_9BILA|nr:hypothetical protein WR25_07888 [Diploscapter pachys]
MSVSLSDCQRSPRMPEERLGPRILPIGDIDAQPFTGPPLRIEGTARGKQHRVLQRQPLQFGEVAPRHPAPDEHAADGFAKYLPAAGLQ